MNLKLILNSLLLCCPVCFCFLHNGSFESTTTVIITSKSVNGVTLQSIEASSEIQNDSITISNCSADYDNFRHSWFQGKLQLLVLLHSLQESNCSEFKEECDLRTFAFNEYSELAYDRFCNRSAFHNKCKIEHKVANSNQSVFGLFNSTRMPSACEQVTMFNPKRKYVEVVSKYTPFCGVTWCGYDSMVAQNLLISRWTCMPKQCRKNVIAVMATVGFLALFTVFANILVIVVITSYPKSKSRQLIYKLCLAAGDLMAGAIVLPLFISTLWIKFVAQPVVHDGVNSTLLQSNAMSQSIAVNISALHENPLTFTIDESLEAGDYYPPGYINTVGVFTSWTMMISLYTLLCASVDQLRCIWKPFSIKIDRALILAKVMTAFVWILSFVISVLPVAARGLSPYHLVTGLVMAHGDYAILLYGVTFLLPLLLLWIVNLFTWMVLRKKEKSAFGRCDDNRIQRKLIKNLTAMIGVFTMSVVPIGLAVITLQIEVKLHRKATDTVVPTPGIDSFDLVATLLLLSKGIWNCLIYNIRSQGFREMTWEKFKACCTSCCIFACGRSLQTATRKVRKRVRLLSRTNIYNF